VRVGEGCNFWCELTAGFRVLQTDAEVFVGVMSAGSVCAKRVARRMVRGF
jgi:hypothetical protein